MDKATEIHTQLGPEIARVSGRADVVVFIDARSVPPALYFCDRDQCAVHPRHPMDHLQTLFSNFRLACVSDVAAPLWLCAVHIQSGTRTATTAFYEGDFDSALQSAALMKILVEERVRSFAQIERHIQEKRARERAQQAATSTDVRQRTSVQQDAQSPPASQPTCNGVPGRLTSVRRADD